MKLPDFLIIGSRKSGTTWLNMVFENHSQINTAQKRKEVHYFDRYYDRGLNWYTSNFNFESDKIIGEATPDYLHNKFCAGRIKKDIPKVKLICIIRNPLKRAYSDFKYIVQNENYQRSFNDALKEYPHILEEGLYYKQLKRYYSLFKEKQIKVVIFEELINDKEKELEKIFDFLEIENYYNKNILRKKSNVSKIPKFKSIYSFGKNIIRKFYDYDLIFIINFLKKMGLKEVFFSNQNTNFPQMTEKDETYMKKYYQKDVLKLEKLLNKELTKIWSFKR